MVPNGAPGEDQGLDEEGRRKEESVQREGEIGFIYMFKGWFIRLIVGGGAADQFDATGEGVEREEEVGEGLEEEVFKGESLG